MSSKQHYSDSSSRQRMNEILSSVAEMENALAEAINAQTRILRKENLNAEQLTNVTDQLVELIVLTIKKEMMLEFLLQDVIDAFEHLNPPDNKR